MRDYWICPRCNAALDHGERCDCQDRFPAGHCFMCNRPLYPEDATHDADLVYEIDGHSFCEDCVDKYVKDNCRKVLRG